MLPERLVETLARQANRRRVLGKLSSGAFVGLLALTGVRQDAGAVVQRQCCLLCHAPSSSCSGCAWCWRCCNQNGTFKCCEYSSPSYCGPNCPQVTCSRIFRVNNNACARAPESREEMIMREESR